VARSIWHGQKLRSSAKTLPLSVDVSNSDVVPDSCCSGVEETCSCCCCCSDESVDNAYAFEDHEFDQRNRTGTSTFGTSASRCINDIFLENHSILQSERCRCCWCCCCCCSTMSKLQFITVTSGLFFFFGIHNYLQELIQQEFKLHQQQLNVMLGYYEVLGCFVFTYIERTLFRRYSVWWNTTSTASGVATAKVTTTATSITTASATIGATNEKSLENCNSIDEDRVDSKKLHSSYDTSMIRKAPLSVYRFLTFCLLSSSVLSHMSLNYINFPTKVMFRSCRLVPTMIIASLLQPQKKFTTTEYTCAVIICIGLICFGAAEFQTQPLFHPIGIFLVSLSVFADALMPNAQESVIRTYHATPSEVTVYTNLFTSILMTITTLVSGDFSACLKLMKADRTVAMYIGVYTLISYVAISYYMKVVQLYGGVAAVLVATGRKALTLIVSFLLFPKVYTIYYPMGTILILSGITYASLSKVYNKSVNNNNSNNSSKNGNKKIDNDPSIVESSVPLLKSIVTETTNGDQNNQSLV
jgi:drug/metabolite transporter (DMT)-like permease